MLGCAAKGRGNAQLGPDLLKEPVEGDEKIEGKNSKKEETKKSLSDEEKKSQDLLSQVNALDKSLIANGVKIECPAAPDANGSVVCKANEDSLVAALSSPEKVSLALESANAMEKFLATASESVFDNAKAYRVELKNVIKRLGEEVAKNKQKSDKEGKADENKKSQLDAEQKALQSEVDQIHDSLKNAGVVLSCVDSTNEAESSDICKLDEDKLAAVLASSDGAAIDKLLSLTIDAEKRLTAVESKIKKSNYSEILRSVIQALTDRSKVLKDAADEEKKKLETQKDDDAKKNTKKKSSKKKKQRKHKK